MSPCGHLDAHTLNSVVLHPDWPPATDTLRFPHHLGSNDSLTCFDIGGGALRLIVEASRKVGLGGRGSISYASHLRLGLQMTSSAQHQGSLVRWQGLLEKNFLQFF